MKVAEIMTREVLTVTSDTPLAKVTSLICLHQFSGMPVVDGDRVVGIVSEKDILKALYPTYTEFYDDPVRSRDFEEMETRYRDMSQRPVEEVMTHNVIVVSPDEPILKAASTMILKKVRRLPVVEGDRLVGIVSQGDIHRAIFAKTLTPH